MQLLTYPSLVESPFIIAEIGNYSFGQYTRKELRNALGARVDVTFPNYVQSLYVKKVNGSLNVYTLRITYAITQFDDPNMLERIFSSISKSRKIVLSYGDWAYPTFIYKKEEAIISKITSDLDIAGSKVSYTVSCMSAALQLRGSKFDFPMRRAKPSDVIKELIYDSRFRLLSIFQGMANKSKSEINALIAGDDKRVVIEAKKNMDALDYINYLVSCMTPATHTSSSIKNGASYFLYINDDILDEYGGTYFKVVKVNSKVPSKNSYDVYEVDVGYPEKDKVINFTVHNDQEWSILYDYSQKIDQTNYSYTIDNNGEIVSSYSPSIARAYSTSKATAANKNWWSKMTEFPISASLQIKGLLRPQMLMNYIRVNVYFYGQKHISSGLYIITKQEDNIDMTGYKTTLTLLRIGGDED